jgi:hypothetical protein
MRHSFDKHAFKSTFSKEKSSPMYGSNPGCRGKGKNVKARQPLTQGRSWEPLHSAVHAEVEHRMRRVAVLQPLVEGGVLRVRRQVALK